MPTTYTDRLGLPIIDLNDNVPDSADEIQNLATKLDDIIDQTVLTSGRPAAPYAGQEIYESNTKIVRRWDGAKWLYMSGSSWGEWLNPDAYNVPANNTSWGPGVLTFARGSIEDGRPASISGEHLVVKEAGEYLFEATVSWNALRAERAYIELWGGVTSPSDETFGRREQINADNDIISTRVHCPNDGYRLSVRLYQSSPAPARTAKVRLKLTRLS